MKLSLKWLQEFIKESLEVDQLAEDLTMLGIEVESIDKIDPPLRDIIVARIDRIERHPQADKLSICQVFDGKDTLNIVCGAINIKEGHIVPLARIGSQLPGGFKIKKAKIRGAHSEGMMCSENEMQLGTDKSGILILPEDMPVGKPLMDVLDLEDTILEISVTPNRGDCLSVKGIAREICALKKIPFTDISFLKGLSVPCNLDPDEDLSVAVKDEELCARYGYGLIRGISIMSSPFSVRYRLTNCGIRPINNIVDITNLIMLELGHPMHAFDTRSLSGGQIIVRKSRKGEEITALDGSRHILDDSHLVIADEKKPIAVAGIMGGQNTEVCEKTTDVVFECAHFNPSAVRRTSAALNLSSESSFRFERNVDISDIEEAVKRAYELVETFFPGSCQYAPVRLKGRENIEKKSIVFRPLRCSRILGKQIPAEEMESILQGLGFEICEKSKDQWSYTVPCHRSMDVEREIDLIEEIARVYGYKHIHEEKESVVSGYRYPLSSDVIKGRLMTLLPSQGFHEVISYCFLSKKESDTFSTTPEEVLELKNPISEDQRFMRTTMIPSLCRILATNIHYGFPDIRIFEIGKTYSKTGENEHQEKTFLSFAVSGIRQSYHPFQKEQPYDFFDIKGMAEMIGESLGLVWKFASGNSFKYFQNDFLSLYYKKNIIGYLGKIETKILSDLYDIDKEVYYGEICIDNLRISRPFEHKFKPIKRFPCIVNDISFLVDRTVPHNEIQEAIQSLNLKELENIEIYDIFEGKNIPDGKKSMAYSLCFRSDRRTLKGEEVKKRVEQIIKYLEKSFQIELRTF